MAAQLAAAPDCGSLRSPAAGERQESLAGSVAWDRREIADRIRAIADEYGLNPQQERQLGELVPRSAEDEVEPTYPLVLAVNRWTQTIKVNGEPVTFTVIGDDSTWLACARIANRLVTVEVQGCRPDHVELEAVDPKNYADVRRP